MTSLPCSVGGAACGGVCCLFYPCHRPQHGARSCGEKGTIPWCPCGAPTAFQATQTSPPPAAAASWSPDSCLIALPFGSFRPGLWRLPATRTWRIFGTTSGKWPSALAIWDWRIRCAVPALACRLAPSTTYIQCTVAPRPEVEYFFLACPPPPPTYVERVGAGRAGTPRARSITAEQRDNCPLSPSENDFPRLLDPPLSPTELRSPPPPPRDAIPTSFVVKSTVQIFTVRGD